ncbi:MAG: hypothetical protein LBP53_00150 [Candidatus Peribacteria bacterium]|nr:hypothetical protein [Candidatus Peribacteria bacterium]
MVIFGYVLMLCALVMGWCRIITVVHRPSDILGGFVLGIIIPLILGSAFFFPYVRQWLIAPLIRLQEWICKWFIKS